MDKNIENNFDYIVVGGGMAGLSFSHEMKKKGYSILIIEKDREVGGLSKTLQYKNFRFDYCAHRFHSANEEVMKKVKEIMGNNFYLHNQKSNEIFEEEKIIYILSSYGFYYLEVDKMYHGKFVGNINQYNTIAGPKDVDLDYFPTWIGKKRVVATSGNTMKYLIDFSEKKFDYYLWEKNN